MIKLLRYLTLLGSLAFVQANAAVVPVVESGKLIGATGILVGGVSFDVRFRDGSCVSVFSGCNEVSDFTFTNISSAMQASAALMDQLFLDTGSALFDSDPSLTLGCENPRACMVFTPFIPYADPYLLSTFGVSAATNFSLIYETLVPYIRDSSTSFYYFSRDGDISWNQGETFAVWTHSADTASIPETPVFPLVTAGLLALVFIQRRRNKKSD